MQKKPIKRQHFKKEKRKRKSKIRFLFSYLLKEKPEYTPEAEVNILIWQKTDLGFKAIIDNKYSGLLYENEIFCPLETGMEMKAFVKQVREDGKVDLILQKPGFEKIDDFSKTLLFHFKASLSIIRLLSSYL